MCLPLSTFRVSAIAVPLAATASTAIAQKSDPFRNAVAGPAQVRLGTIGSLVLPAEMICLIEGVSIAEFYKLSHYTPAPGTLAILLARDDSSWVCIRYSDTGHVADDEKNELTPEAVAAVLAAVVGATEQENAVKRNNGWKTLSIVGWQKPPFYDERTRNLTSSLLVKSSDRQEWINYTSRVLGRSGLLEIRMALRPQDVGRCVPAYDRLVSGIRFDQGNTTPSSARATARSRTASLGWPRAAWRSRRRKGPKALAAWAC